jgi:hypothetical protein
MITRALVKGTIWAHGHLILWETLSPPVNTPYWITWSARSSSVCGIVRPSALALLRLIASSNLPCCSIGKSAGLAPLRILSTKIRGAPKQISKVRCTSASALQLQEFRELADGPGPVIGEELLPGEQ